MNGFFLIILEIFVTAMALIPIYFLLNKVLFHSMRKSVLYCIFSMYLVAVGVFVGLPNITYVRLDFTLNWIPFAGFLADLKNGILNVLLFVPLGIMLPILWSAYRTPKATVLFGFGMSMVIELLQIFTYRATDVNDLITNTFGTLLGYAVANGLMKGIPAIQDLGQGMKTKELCLVCAATLAVMFFLHPFLSGMLWSVIL